MLDTDATSPRDAFWYYRMNDLEAVRAGRWKLHLAKAGTPVHELYDVVADPGEATDRAAQQPAEVARLTAIADDAHRSLGDARLGLAGAAVRPLGRVPDGRPLTTYDPHHPLSRSEPAGADCPHNARRHVMSDEVLRSLSWVGLAVGIVVV